MDTRNIHHWLRLAPRTLAALFLLALAAASARDAAAQGYQQAGTAENEERKVDWSAGFSFSTGTHQYRIEEIEAAGADVDEGSLAESDRHPETKQVTEFGLAFTRPGPDISVFFSVGLLAFKDEFDRSFDDYGFYGSFGLSWTFFRTEGTPSIFLGVGFGAHVGLSRLEKSDGTRLNSYIGEAPVFAYIGIEIVENLMITAFPTITVQGMFLEGDDPSDPQGLGATDREGTYREKRLIGIGFGVAYRFEFLLAEAELRLLNDTVFVLRVSYCWR